MKNMRDPMVEATTDPVIIFVTHKTGFSIAGYDDYASVSIKTFLNDSCDKRVVVFDENT
jgi:hypothetical protein